jgi:hypothetical protein
MKEANQIAAENLRQLKDANTLRLDLSARTWGNDSGLFIELTVANVSQVVAHIQRAYIDLVGDHPGYDPGRWGDGLQEEEDRSGNGLLVPGRKFTCKFCDCRTDPVDKVVVDHGIDFKTLPEVVGIVVEANNKLFRCVPGDWLAQIRQIQRAVPESRPST